MKYYNSSTLLLKIIFRKSDRNLFSKLFFNLFSRCIAMENGFIRLFPGGILSPFYDPRKRSWYTYNICIFRLHSSYSSSVFFSPFSRKPYLVLFQEPLFSHRTDINFRGASIFSSSRYSFSR